MSFDVNSEKVERIKELVKILNKASRSYYQGSEEIMSNLQYDSLYDELVLLEKETGIVMSQSPTQNVGFKPVSELPKKKHEKPMLSLNKTKSVAELSEFAGIRESLLSWKLDGLTIVLRYENGELKEAVTRGNGEIGELITDNARAFSNLPGKIAFKGTLTLRGEAIITYSEFKKINEKITEASLKYKNPRNLCSGSVRQLDPNITKKRNVKLIAFTLVSAVDLDGKPCDFGNKISEELKFLENQGFETVFYKRVNKENMEEAVEYFRENVKENDFPSDGLVLTYDDISYGESLGRTAKYPRNAIAFKWSDEKAETILREIEWSASRTGLINPIAVFDSVELEGTSVKRASLHNLSYLEDLMLGIGDRITVYKANMIIPQIAENLTKSGPLKPIENCPSCGGKTEIRMDNDSKYLFCPNLECPAKKIKNFALFVSRDAMNIDGLSEMTLEKLIDDGIIGTYNDIFHLEKYKERIVSMEGFGEKSYENLISSIEKARKTELYRVLYGMGIAGIGLQTSKMLCKYFEDDIDRIKNSKKDDFMDIDGIGEVLADNLIAYFKNPKKTELLDMLLSNLEIIKHEKSVNEEKLKGKTFVITGSLNHFTNRKELQEKLESLGAKVSSSVSKNTFALINNNIESNSGKNKKAKDLGVEIITEEQCIERFLNL